MTGDPYVYPGTQILRNTYGIRDPDGLEQAERLISRFAIRRPLNPAPDMTPEGLARIHRHIFGHIYPWAGEIRAVNLEKVVGDKTVAFELGPFVKPGVAQFFHELRQDNYLRGLDPGTFAYRAAVYMEDLNFLHPFREGNGRVQRVFLEQLARDAGHHLDLALIDERGWIDGAIQSHRQPIDGKHDIMTKTIERALVGPHQAIKSPAMEPGARDIGKANTGRNAGKGRGRSGMGRGRDDRDR